MIIEDLYFLYLISYNSFGKIVMFPNVFSLKEADDQSIIWVIMEKKIYYWKTNVPFSLHFIHTSHKQKGKVRWQKQGPFSFSEIPQQKRAFGNERSELERLYTLLKINDA